MPAPLVPQRRRHGVGALTVAATAALLLAAPRPLRSQADSTRRPAPPAATDTTAGRLARLRILGVYDEETGDPIEGADVSDLVSGFTVRTTKTGTVPLYLTDTTSTLVRIRKIGYQQAVLMVSESLRDTIPVTTTLVRMGHALPAVVVVGHTAVKLDKADTVPELLKNGFYIRRLTSVAPRAAFITGDKLQGGMLLSDARFFGRAICESNIYVDGVPFRVPARTGRFLNEGIDEYFSPYDVAGIETYYIGESPADVTGTTTGSAALDDPANGTVSAGNGTINSAGTLAGNECVTLIWLRH